MHLCLRLSEEGFHLNQQNDLIMNDELLGKDNCGLYN